MTRGRLLSAALAFAALSFAVPTVGQATLLDFQLTVIAPAGNLPEFFQGPPRDLAVTTFSLSVTAPMQTTANPGDTIEVDLLAPAGLQFVIATPAGAFNTFLNFSVRTAFVAGNLVATGTSSVTGEGGSGTIFSQNNGTQLINGTGWEAEGNFNTTGTVSFTEISVQVVVPAGVTLPLTGLSGTAINAVDILTDPGDFVSLEAIPTAVPEPASLAIFGTALAGLGLIRRRRRKDV